METKGKNAQLKIEKWLQNEAEKFIAQSALMINGVEVVPKEIEVYYFKEDEFEDDSVHRNVLQQMNKNHLYVHRNGLKETDSYKGGNRPGMDFVISDEKDVFYSYLIRSAVINTGEPIIGPNKVLKKVLELSGLKEYQLEQELVKVKTHDNSGIALFSKRINLSKGFVNSELRVVICDNMFRGAKYPGKEAMVIDYLSNTPGKMTYEESLSFANTYLGYVPSRIRNNN